jgi:hypothetical protein
MGKETGGRAAGDARLQVGLAETEGGRSTRVGPVTKADVDRGGADVDSGLEGRQVASRAHEVDRRVWRGWEYSLAALMPGILYLRQRYYHERFGIARAVLPRGRSVQ